MSKVFDRFFEEFALGHGTIEFVLLEEFQDLLDMFDVVLLIFTVDQDVVNVDNDSNVEEGSKNILDQRLKGSWGIGESKRHNLVLVVAISSAKCCLWDV